MAAPNIAAVTTITGKTKGAAVTTSVADLLENPAGSGKVFKVNMLRMANIDGANAVDVTANFYDATGPTSYKIANTISLPADAAIDLLEKGQQIYLEEGDKITIQASANSDAEAVVSYEELS